MCKLCNTDTPPIVLSSHITPRSKKVSIMRDKGVKRLKVIIEYTEELPCKVCYTTMKNFLNKRGENKIDEWVLQRLYKAYVKKQEHSKHLKEVRKSKERKKAKESYRTHTLVETNIRKTRFGTYLVSFHRSKFSIDKNFKTLKEAQQFKKRILDEHKTT